MAPLREHAGKLETAMSRFAGPLLESIQFVRQYAGPPLPEDRKSVSFRLTVGSAERTLSSDEVAQGYRDVVDPSGPTASYVTARPAEGWLSLIRSMLKTGPVIVGIGAPAGHFVLAHGIIAGALLVADPGGVLYQAHNGGTTEIANWKGKEGYLDGTMDKEKVRMPSPSQWPGGNAPGQEADGRSYNHISGQYLSDMRDKLISVTSLTSIRKAPGWWRHRHLLVDREISSLESLMERRVRHTL